MTFKISVKVSSSVPMPAMALCKCWHRYSTSGVIKPIMTSSNFPPNSLFKSSIKSRSNSASYLDLICWRWALERVVRIFIISSSLVPKPFIAARKVWLSAAASKGLTGTTVGMGCAPKKHQNKLIINNNEIEFKEIALKTMQIKMNEKILWTYNLPPSSPTVTCCPLGIQDTRFSACEPSTIAEAVGTSIDVHLNKHVKDTTYEGINSIHNCDRFEDYIFTCPFAFSMSPNNTMLRNIISLLTIQKSQTIYKQSENTQRDARFDSKYIYIGLILSLLETLSTKYEDYEKCINIFDIISAGIRQLKFCLTRRFVRFEIETVFNVKLNK
uniref:Uncharacterized protein n=1 Tax=Glossina austeni TaxID=7395 RepID=A0A1A9VBL7_GLOAU